MVSDREETGVGAEGKGNGDRPKPPPIDLLELRHSDGLITRSNSAQNQGVILKSITAIEKNSDYRQELKIANFQTPDEADEFVAASNECRVLNMDETPIVDQMIGRNAGVKHGLLFEAFRTLTHFSLFTNNKKEKDESGYKNNGSKF